MAIFRGLSKLIGSRREIYNSIKFDGAGKFYLDNNSLQRSLEAQGISEYAKAATSILKQAGEEITGEFKHKIGPHYTKRYLVVEAFWYLLGANSFCVSISWWRHSRFFRNA